MKLFRLLVSLAGVVQVISATPPSIPNNSIGTGNALSASHVQLEARKKTKTHCLQEGAWDCFRDCMKDESYKALHSGKSDLLKRTKGRKKYKDDDVNRIFTVLENGGRKRCKTNCKTTGHKDQAHCTTTHDEMFYGLLPDLLKEIRDEERRDVPKNPPISKS